MREAIGSRMGPEVKSVVIGTAGHIDHGKTALVRRLTGVDTDRLPEEKRRGITIDLGFAPLETRTPEGAPLRLSFVDVPGHKLFVRNMLAGSGGIDCVMLVISAEEGVKPQTEEHLAICTMLGVERGLTVLTKADAVSPTELEGVRCSTARFLKGSFLSDERAPIVTVSARTGEGVPELLAELVSIASRSPMRSFASFPRVPIDRAFVMTGFGTVVTGTLQSGIVSQGQTILIEPGSREARVRGLHVHRQQQQEVRAGSRVALNLSGIDVSQVRRGDTLVLPSTFRPAEIVDVELQLLAQSPALKNHSRIRFHAFTSDTIAAVSLYGSKSVEPARTGLARLKLSEPVVLLPGDRFVIRQCSPAVTIGGGRVLDANPLPRLARTKRLEWLQALKNASIEQQIWLRVERRNTTGLTLRELSSESGLGPAALEAILGSLAVQNKIVAIPGHRYMAFQANSLALNTVVAEVKRSFSPGANSGLKRSELKARTGLCVEVFQYAIDTLSRERKVTLKGDLVLPFGSAPGVAPADQNKLDVIAGTYAKAGLAAPPPQSVAAALKLSDSEFHRLMTVLLRNETLVKVGTENLYVHREALGQLYLSVRRLRGRVLDVGTFKELTGLSRKYAIPLLEHLDRQHITCKRGDSRVVL